MAMHLRSRRRTLASSIKLCPLSTYRFKACTATMSYSIAHASTFRRDYVIQFVEQNALLFHG